MSKSQVVSINVPVAVPLCKIRRSSSNMRTINPKGNPEDKELVASIRENGVLQNICVYAVDDMFEAPAGGRRLGALEALSKAGEIPDDYPVFCLVISADDAQDISLIENEQRKAPHPADVFRAYSDLHKAGNTIKAIAIRHSTSELQVQKYLRLGKVHKTLFKLFSRDLLSIDAMMAWASTSNTKLQLATYKAMGENNDASPASIRSRLADGRALGDSSLANFVTVESYVAAGGAIEEDLFTNQVLLCDLELLTDLAEKKLQKAAADLEGQSWKWISTSLEGMHAVYDYQRLPSERSEVPKELEDRRASMEKRLLTIEEIDDSKWDDDIQAEYDSLEEEIDVLSERIDEECTYFSDEVKSLGGCLVTFCAVTSELLVLRGLMNDQDLKEYRATVSSKEQHSADSDSTSVDPASSKPEISQKLAFDLGLYRRSIIATELANDADLAIDLLHFHTCSSVLATSFESRSFSLNIRGSIVDNESSIGDYRDTNSAIAKAAIYEKLDTSWLAHKSEVKRFQGFQKLTPAKKKKLVAYCASCTLQYGTEKPNQNLLVEHLITKLKIEFSDHWRPTSDNYFTRLTLPLLIAMGKKVFGAKWCDDNDKKAKKEIVSQLDALFSGSDKNYTAQQLKHRKRWVPTEISK